MSQPYIYIHPTTCVIDGKTTNNNIVSKNDSTTINKIKRNDTICINSSKKDSNIFVYEELDGWLKLSLDEKILKNNLGKPEKKGKDEYMGATGTYIQEWDYKSKGIKFDMESDTIGIPKHIFSITIKSPSKLKTKQNIGIESEENVVREKYSKQISKEFSDKETIVVGSIYGGTIFKIKNGKVTEIFIGADND